MESALLQVAHLRPRRNLLLYDAAAHAQKLSRQPHLYAVTSAEDCETVSEDVRVAAYTDLLDFIAGAQQECYALFGDDGARWGVDEDGAAAEAPSSHTRASSSVPANSTEWSDEDGADERGSGGGGDGGAHRKRRRSGRREV
ncbi:hypothetical protein NESM_000785100 [Novymonas esmeraldas]|uniref:Uncharacterized protein n=1 Tax=Novymonas esmeraldas TaxID=1808958 RepID=A0AAW0EXP3_9TRYP